MFILCGCAEPDFNAGGVYYKANIYLCSSFFLTRLQGALERKKQTADETAQIKRSE